VEIRSRASLGNALKRCIFGTQTEPRSDGDMGSISTDRGAISAKPGADGKRQDYAVKGEPGLRLRVSANRQGSNIKIWSLLYTRKSDGKKCRVTLGEYPAMGLAEARRTAGGYRNDVRTGADPAGDRRDDKLALTFAMLAAEWLERYAKVQKRSWREDERMLSHDVLPAIGAMKAGKVSKADVVKLVNAVYDRGATYQANQVLGLVQRIFKWGVKRGQVQESPAALLDKPGQEQARTRCLSEVEIRSFWYGLDRAPMTPPLRLVFRLALLLGQRANEIALARKAEIDLEARLWAIPKERFMPKGRKTSGTKNKRDHLLPLTSEAIRIFEQAFALAGPGEWVFPGKVGGAPIGDSAISRAWGRARGPLGLADVRTHDLRRTFATLAGDSGAHDFDIGLTLNHESVRGTVTSRIYNRADYLPEKRKVLEAVENRLLRILAGSTAPSLAEASQ
jgi:integrase